MAYRTIKLCARCENRFICKSNSQKYCSPCRPIIRKEKNVMWQHNHYMKVAPQKNEKSRAYNKSEKGRAAQQLRDAVRQGKIQRQPCEVCGEPNAQGHHDNYDEPLKVIWLCAKHHREEHLFEPWQNELRRTGHTGGFLLGELIEACGEKEFVLSYSKDEWEAEGYYWCCDEHGEGRKFGHGSTPEEAVANLWLALNTKV